MTALRYLTIHTLELRGLFTELRWDNTWAAPDAARFSYLL